MSEEFHNFLATNGFKIISGLIKKSNIVIDANIKTLILPVDEVFVKLDNSLLQTLVDFNKEKVTELVNSYIIDYFQVIIDKVKTILRNRLGDEILLENGKLTNVIMMGNPLVFKGVVILPIGQLLLTERFGLLKQSKLQLEPKSITGETQMSPEKQNELAYILRQPRDIMQSIALYLNGNDLLNFCLTSLKFNETVCSDFKFWIRKINQDFPDKIKILPKPKELPWRDYYTYLMYPTDELNYLPSILLNFYKVDPYSTYFPVTGAPSDNVGLFQEHIYRILRRIIQPFEGKRGKNKPKFIIKFKRISKSQLYDERRIIDDGGNIDKDKADVDRYDKIISRGYDAEPIIAVLGEMSDKYKTDTDVETTARIYTYLKYGKPVPILTWETVPENSPYPRGALVFD